MENFFKFKERGTDMKTEMIAGVTTFMTMAYILAVNPNILGHPAWIRELFSQLRLWLQRSHHFVWHCLQIFPLSCPLVWD